MNNCFSTLLPRPEGKTLEFKRDLSAPRGVLRTLVAFANTAGGTVLIGVEDSASRVCGVSDPLALDERLASMISDQIAPSLVPDIEVLPWRKTHVVAVLVHPSPNRPHFLRREGLEKGTYVRVGSTNRRSDSELIDELRRHARGEGFDEQAMPDLDSEAIDFRAASESFAALRKLSRRDLATLRLVTTHQGRLVPQSAQCGGRTAGICRRWRCGKRSSTRWFMQTTASAALRSGWPCSTTDWRSKIPACFHSA